MKTVLSLILAFASTPLFAGDIEIHEAYARVARPGAPVGAMFMVIYNNGETDDRLVSAASPVAKKVELHTHIEDNGIMKMREVEGGFPVPAGGHHELARGGDHVMLMGLTETLENGMAVPLTLVFESAGEMQFDVIVDNDRQQGQHGMGHGEHEHGDRKNHAHGHGQDG